MTVQEQNITGKTKLKNFSKLVLPYDKIIVEHPVCLEPTQHHQPLVLYMYYNWFVQSDSKAIGSNVSYFLTENQAADMSNLKLEKKIWKGKTRYCVPVQFYLLQQ